MKMNSTTMISYENPIKSENDKKEYRVICLENGLTACLISDIASLNAVKIENTFEIDREENIEASSDNSDNQRIKKSETDMKMKLSAACLNIRVGSFSDPEHIQGLAHFLEHMVYKGSEKYPVENDFDSFLQKRGGTANAKTECETTSFYFECQQRDLSEALDKLSQFFIAPLLKRDAMNRERMAVDSEFQMAIQSDPSKHSYIIMTS